MLKECTQCLVTQSPLNFSEYSRRCKKCETKPTYEELEEKLRHALWAIKSLEKLKISQTQRAIIEVALTKINER